MPVGWTDVEPEAERAWYEVITGLDCGPADAGCPSCGRATLRYFFLRGDDPNTKRGGFWIWCPACLSSMHLSADVPDWWTDDPAVNAEDLEPEPSWLEEHWVRLRVGPEA